MNTETRQVFWSEHENDIKSLTRRADDHLLWIDTLSARIDALEQARAAEPQPLPASPAPVEPAPAPETPEQTATRLLGDPETFAAVLRSVARHGNGFDRQQLHDAIRAQEGNFHSNAAGLRLLAAAIAAGSFAS